MPIESQPDPTALDNTADPVVNAPKRPGKDPALSARDELLARLDEKIVAMRVEDDEKFLASADVDPRAAALAADMAREARGQKTAAEQRRETPEDPEVVEDADAGAGDAAEAEA